MSQVNVPEDKLHLFTFEEENEFSQLMKDTGSYLGQTLTPVMCFKRSEVT